MNKIFFVVMFFLYKLCSNNIVGNEVGEDIHVLASVVSSMTTWFQ